MSTCACRSSVKTVVFFDQTVSTFVCLVFYQHGGLRDDSLLQRVLVCGSFSCVSPSVDVVVVGNYPQSRPAKGGPLASSSVLWVAFKSMCSLLELRSQVGKTQKRKLAMCTHR